MIAYVHNIVHANCRMCTLFLPEIDWDRECDRQLFVSLGHFFALLPHYWPKKLKFGKNVKKPGDIILVHMCTINEDHMIYGSWDIRHDWQMEIPVSHRDIIILQMSIKNHDHMLYCSWDIVHDDCNCFFLEGWHFLPFYPRKSPKIMIICYTIPEIWHVTNVIVIFHFRLFLVLLFPNSPKKNKKKNENTTSRYHH